MLMAWSIPTVPDVTSATHGSLSWSSRSPSCWRGSAISKRAWARMRLTRRCRRRPIRRKRRRRFANSRPAANPAANRGTPPTCASRLPAERLTAADRALLCRILVKPVRTTCRRAGADDPEPHWHQVVELPEIPVQVTEYQAHGRTCPHCGHVTWAKIPEEIRDHVCGPRLTATLSFLSGVLHASKRGIEEFVETVLSVPIALGTVSNLEQEMSAALADAHAEAQQAVQQAAAKNVDETGWKQAGAKRWLWGAATAVVACFVIAPTRGAWAWPPCLGKKIKGIISSDRWSVYGQLKLGLRQLCWAHLKRDFQKLVDRGGDAQDIGEMGLDAVRCLFHEWHLFRGGG